MRPSEVWARATATHKHCTKCEKFKPLEEFRKDARARGGLASWCRLCANASQLGWIHANKVKAYAQHRRSRVGRLYGEDGLTNLDRIEAGEVCEACGGRTSKMPIEHCHDTGSVRGILCGNCNTALGLLQEDLEIIRGLLSYMNKYNGVRLRG